MSEEDLTQALTAACICCILAKAGPQRSRILANLYKDERTRALPIFPFLQKVYLERILRQEEARRGGHGPHALGNPSSGHEANPWLAGLSEELLGAGDVTCDVRSTDMLPVKPGTQTVQPPHSCTYAQSWPGHHPGPDWL